MSDHTPSPWWAVLLAELTAAGIGGHAIESLSHLPGWVGGLFGGLVMGVTLRLLDPLLRLHGERIARRSYTSQYKTRGAHQPLGALILSLSGLLVAKSGCYLELQALSVTGTRL